MADMSVTRENTDTAVDIPRTLKLRCQYSDHSRATEALTLDSYHPRYHPQTVGLNFAAQIETLLCCMAL